MIWAYSPGIPGSIPGISIIIKKWELKDMDQVGAGKIMNPMKKKRKLKKHWTIGMRKKMQTEKMKYLGKLDLDNEKDLKRRLGKGKNLTHISLFTGIGGFDIGFAKAGIKTRVMVEFDKYCCQTLRANFYWEELKKRTKENGKPLYKTPTQLDESPSENSTVILTASLISEELVNVFSTQPKLGEAVRLEALNGADC